jgi:ADP-L-glycero-D-manno-heptose 6-epimerase
MILITGSKGFISSHFKERLNDNIIEVDKDNCFDFLNNFRNWENIDLILHQGAITSTTEKNIDALYRYNVAFSINLFEKAIKFQIPIKYASSASVYGNSQHLFNPLNFYAISKLQIDYFVMDNIEKFKFIQGFRYFNVYGENEEHKRNQASPISKFQWQIKEEGKINLFEGSDYFFRDFIYVKDLVEIVLNNNKPSGIYDLGTCSPISFMQVAEIVSRKYNCNIHIVPFPENLKNQYQKYTCSNEQWIYNFMTVQEYFDKK